MASQINSANNEPRDTVDVINPRGTIFVFGSLDIRANQAERAQFEASCRSLGKVLAANQFLISVASAATFTVDLHVLAGADAWCEGKAALPVQFIGPAQLPPDEPPLENDSNQFPNLECQKRLLRGGWEPSHERQLQEADGIIPSAEILTVFRFVLDQPRSSEGFRSSPFPFLTEREQNSGSRTLRHCRNLESQKIPSQQ